MVSDRVEVRRQDAVEMLRSLPDESVNMVLTDPPYGISYQSNWSEVKTAPIAGDHQFNPGILLDEIVRVLKNDSAAFLFTRWDVYPEWYRSVPTELNVKNLIVWNKDNHSSGDLFGDFGAKWEGLMFIVKGRPKLRGYRHNNVWDFPRMSRKGQRHPAEKPVALLRRAIESFTDEDDLVVDPFCGSGSTAEAAFGIGRRALVGDIDQQYVKIARQRLGLTDDSPSELPSRPLDREVLINLSALDGLHPEDVRAMIEDRKERQRA